MVSRSIPVAKVVTLAVALFLLHSAYAQAAEVFIDISRKKGTLIKAAVQELTFRSTGAYPVEQEDLGKIAKTILDFDLNISGYINTIGDDELLNDITEKDNKTKRVNWDEWKSTGAVTLIKGEYFIKRNKDIVIELRLYDIERHEQITGVRYIGARSIFRKMVHRFANQVIYRFSGTPGVADTSIAFISRTKGHKELFTADYDGYSQKQITRNKSITIQPAWSPLGNHILFTTYRYKNPDIYAVDIELGTMLPLINYMGLNSSAAWSPDGKKIAFAKSVRGNSDIYVQGIDGTNIRRITFTTSIETSPSFSHDGKSIAYLSDFSGTPQIYIMGVDGKNKRRITFGGSYNVEPAWSPTRDKIVYAGITNGQFNIFVKNLKSNETVQLTSNTGNNESPVWSPDGRMIAFSSTRNGSKQIFIMNENGGMQTQVTRRNGGGFSPTWSPREKDNK